MSKLIDTLLSSLEGLGALVGLVDLDWRACA